MGKKLGVTLVVLTVLATATPHVAAQVASDLPGGTTLTVAIDSPAAGAVLQSGAALTISGTASVGEAPALKNTDLVFVVDTSGSTGDPSGLACGTILSCEKTAVLDLVQQANAPRSPISNIGIVGFPNTGVLGLVAPSSANIGTYLNGLGSNGTTDFSSGVSRARQVLSTSTADEQLIVLLTDGDGTSNPNEPAIEAVVLAFTIGGQQCTASLTAITARGRDGSACAVVTDLGQLSGVIQQTIGSSLDSVTVTVDGQAKYSNTTPVQGPISTTFSTTVNGLAQGAHTVCATSTGSDALGSGSAEECRSVTVLAPGTVIVDCGAVAGDCAATATDPGRSTLAFNAPSTFDETVTIVPNVGAAGACAGQNCKTGYDVLFPTTTATGPVVSLTVLTAQPVSVKDRLQAAVFIDNVRITAQCNNRALVKLIRDKLGKPEPIPCITIQYQPTGQVEYFVKFNSDPGVRFR